MNLLDWEFTKNVLTSPKLKGYVLSKGKTTPILSWALLNVGQAISAIFKSFHVHESGSVIHVTTHMARNTHPSKNDV